MEIKLKLGAFKHHQAFNPLAQLFIKTKKTSKKLNLVLLENYLSPLSLAYWFMDDGSKLDYKVNGSKGIVLNTQGFDIKEVEQLQKLVTKKLNLKCWVKTNKSKPILAISEF